MRLFSLFITLYLFTHSAFAQKEEYFFQLDVYKKQPTLFVSSIKTYACSNYGIFIRQGWSGDTLVVNIIGIDSRQNCNHVIGTAKEWLPINGISSEVFFLRILWEKKVNTFNIEFDGENFDVDAVQSDFIVHVTN
ncbi:MAG: hypothetical protein WCW35_13370 [Bacteroidota bacterium]